MNKLVNMLTDKGYTVKFRNNHLDELTMRVTAVVGEKIYNVEHNYNTITGSNRESTVLSIERSIRLLVAEDNKIYISGKMTGVEDYNRQAFNEMEWLLELEGYKVFNPAKIEGEAHWGWEEYMAECIRNLPDCTQIVMLDGWEDSRGAIVERYVAKHLGLKILTEAEVRESRERFKKERFENEKT